MSLPILTRSLEQALQSVSATPARPLPCLGQPSCECHRSGSGPRGVFGGGLHRHACVEVCYGVSGACRLWRRGGFVRLRAGELLVIPPDVAHAEGWEAPGTPYRLLWLAQVGEVGQAFADTYTPAKGWKIEESFAARNAGGTVVTGALAGGGGTTARYLLQGGVLTWLAEMLRHAEAADAADGSRDMKARIDEVRRYLDLHYPEPVSVASVAALFRLSPNYLNALFSRQAGMGIHAYLLQRRLAAAADLLQRGGLLVKEVASRAGFADPLYFCRVYRRAFGRPPSRDARR